MINPFSSLSIIAFPLFTPSRSAILGIGNLMGAVVFFFFLMLVLLSIQRMCAARGQCLILVAAKVCEGGLLNRPKTLRPSVERPNPKDPNLSPI